MRSDEPYLGFPLLDQLVAMHENKNAARLLCDQMGEDDRFARSGREGGQLSKHPARPGLINRREGVALVVAEGEALAFWWRLRERG